MRFFVRAGLFALVLAGAGAAPAQQAPIIIKFSHVVAPDTPKGRGAERFRQLAEERTKGRVKVEVYPNSQLYKDKEEIEALQLGSVQMLAPSLSKFGPLGVKEFEAFDLPYLFDNYDDLHKVTRGPLGESLLKRLQARGITGLAYWDNGFKEFTANKPLRRPEDFKGQKMRIQSSKVLDAQMRSVGAVPQVLAFSEVYQALQSGVVDGTENTPSNIYTQKTHEVQKVLTLTHHGYIGYAVVVNKKFWDGLPPDLRTTLEGAMKDATQYADELSKQENDQALEAMRKSGKIQLVEPSADEKKALKKAMLAVHREMESRVGKDTEQEFYKATGFDPKTL
jgi:C4-dicarboxylate-binding protein DctP